MKRTNSEIRKQARQALDGNWGKGIIATIIYLLIMGTYPNIISFAAPQDRGLLSSSLIWVLLCLPFQWSFFVFFLHIIRDDRVSYGNLFDGYSDFFRILFTCLLQSIYTFLWSLLLIVPGIVKALSYSMTPFVLRDHPELKYNSAIEESMRLMKGSKMKLFVLYLSFIGWAILCILTFGIGFLFLEPYIQSSKAAFYQDLLSVDAENIENATKAEDIPSETSSVQEL